MIEEFPLVAVITPVLNGEDYIEEAMESVQAQTYPNLVHIIHDNASTDRTPDIIARFHNARVPVIVERNGDMLTQAENWECAFRRTPAEARYMRLLCHDDVLRADCIERTVALAETNPDITYVTSGVIVGQTCNWSSLPRNLGEWPSGSTVLSGREVVRRVLLDRAWVIGNQMTLRTEVLDHYDPLIDANWRYNIDTELALRCALEGQVGFVSEPLAFMRLHADTVSAKTARLEPYLFNSLQFILRWGNESLSPAELSQALGRFKPVYIRRLVKWRLQNPEAWDYHAAQLRAAGQMPGLLDYVSAILEWPLSKLRRPNPIYTDPYGRSPEA